MDETSSGRVYDPELGRFMSADPFVQAPYNSQSYNRYSYVFNNPLSFTDPTGYTTEATKYDVEELPVTCDSACMEQHRKKLEAQQNAINQSNIAYWSASQNSGEQWSYMNGAAYNIANFHGMLAFALAAGESPNDSSTGLNGGILSQVGLWVGAGGSALEASKGYIGINRANSLDWRFYKNPWVGNGSVNTRALATLGKPVGVASVLIGVAADSNKLASARTTKEKQDAGLSLALNTTLGVAAMRFPKLGLPGFAKGVADEYGPFLMGGAIHLLREGQRDPNTYIRAPNNDLRKAWDEVCVSCKK